MKYIKKNNNNSSTKERLLEKRTLKTEGKQDKIFLMYMAFKLNLGKRMTLMLAWNGDLCGRRGDGKFESTGEGCRVSFNCIL